MELLVKLLPVVLQLYHIAWKSIALPSPGRSVSFQGWSITYPWDKSCHAWFLFYHNVSPHPRAFLLFLGHFALNSQTFVILVTLWRWWALGRYLHFSQGSLSKCLFTTLWQWVCVTMCWNCGRKGDISWPLTKLFVCLGLKIAEEGWVSSLLDCWLFCSLRWWSCLFSWSEGYKAYKIFRWLFSDAFCSDPFQMVLLIDAC